MIGPSGASPKRAGWRTELYFRALRELLGQNKRLWEIARQDCRRVQDILCSLPPNASKRLPGLALERAAAAAKERGWPALHRKTPHNNPNIVRAIDSHPFQKWFSLFLASIGAKTPGTIFYSFAHCLGDILRDTNLSIERVRAP
jgi:hypothetical protein